MQTLENPHEGRTQVQGLGLTRENPNFAGVDSEVATLEDPDENKCALE